MQRFLKKNLLKTDETNVRQLQVLAALLLWSVFSCR